MNQGKKAIVWLLALALVMGLGLASAAWAVGPKGMGHGPGMMNLTPEQAGKLFDLKEKFRSDTANLRKSLMIKRLEMRDLWKAENPDEKAILAKQKELNALRDQLMEKMVPFRLEARKIAPQAACGFGMGRGFGMGHGMGMGMGMGPGGGMGMAPPAPPAAK
jgi:zinc resistance-associated protein